MDRSFVLPIAIAAAAHGALFLSDRKSEVTSVLATVPQKIVWETRDLPPPEPEDPKRMEERGEPPPVNPPPIRQVDVPDINVDPGRFRQEADVTTRIPIVNPGVGRISDRWRDDVAGIGTGDASVPILSLDNTPSARFQPAPLYPNDLKSSGLTGRVIVTFSMDTSGNVYNEQVVSADHSAFAESALRAVRKWRFDPGVKGNKRVAFQMSQSFEFTLAE